MKTFKEDFETKNQDDKQQKGSCYLLAIKKQIAKTICIMEPVSIEKTKLPAVMEIIKKAARLMTEMNCFRIWRSQNELAAEVTGN